MCRRRKALCRHAGEQNRASVRAASNVSPQLSHFVVPRVSRTALAAQAATAHFSQQNVCGRRRKSFA
jgi:hypothetical protein